MEYGVVFPDESSMQQISVFATDVHRPSGKGCNDRQAIPTLKYSPSQLIWDLISMSDTATLYFLSSKITITWIRYLKLVCDKIKLDMDVHWCSIFMMMEHRVTVQGLLNIKRRQIKPYRCNDQRIGHILIWSRICSLK